MATITIPSQQYAAGPHPFGPVSMASGSRIQLSLLRQSWPDSGGAEIISIEAVTSLDGGQTWSGVLGVNPSIQFGCAGGQLPNDKFGQPVNSSVLTTSIQTPCQIKGRVVLQQPLTTTITITVT